LARLPLIVHIDLTAMKINKATMLHCQLSWVMVVVSGLCFGFQASAHSLRTGQSPLDAAFQGEEVARKEVLAKDRVFWGEMTAGTELELQQLAKVAGSSRKKGAKLAGLQLVGSHEAPSDSATMASEAELLNGFYEDSKKRIVQLNQHEAVSKQRYLEHQATDRARVSEIESEFRGKHADSALKAHLEDEEGFFKKYWERVRARNHKQFHTCLKIQHGLMDRLGSMREAYKQAAEQPAMAVQPEVAASALIQHQSFVQEALVEVAAQQALLASWD